MIEILIYIAVIGLFATGVIMTLVNLPGIWLVFIGLLVFAIYNGFVLITGSTLWLLFGVTLVIGFIDNLVILLGAKKYGSSKWGMFGAILGGMIGILSGPVGLIVGPFIGATLFELAFAKKDMNTALKAGRGALFGFLASLVIKFGGVVAMAIWGLFKMF
jgi:uncharacterized protein